MTILERVKNTPLTERPKIQINNDAPRFMNDLEFEEHLNFMENFAEIPKPEPTVEEKLDELEKQFKEFKTGIESVINKFHKGGVK